MLSVVEGINLTEEIEAERMKFRVQEVEVILFSPIKI